jgi:hypothetical protein
LFWICIDVIVVRVKVSRGFEPFSPWGPTVRTLINRPTGRFAWTNHIYFQITQPGSREAAKTLLQLRIL